MQQSDGRTHLDRVLMEEKALRELMPGWLLAQLAERLAAHRQGQSSAGLAHVEALVAEFEAAPILPARSRCHCEGHSLAKHRTVLYRGLQSWGWIQLPMFACTTCGNQHAMPACAAGCGGSSPVTPSIWFDQALLNLRIACKVFLVGKRASAHPKLLD